MGNETVIRSAGGQAQEGQGACPRAPPGGGPQGSSPGLLGPLRPQGEMERAFPGGVRGPGPTPAGVVRTQGGGSLGGTFCEAIPRHPTGPGSLPAPQRIPPLPGSTPAASSCQPGGVQGRSPVTTRAPQGSLPSTPEAHKSFQCASSSVPSGTMAPSEGHQADKAIPGGRGRFCV